MTETLDRDLHLKIDGKTYDIKSPDIPTGRYIIKLMSVVAKTNDNQLPSDKEVASLKLDDDEEMDLYARILGPAADQMVADGVGFTDYSLAGQTVMIWVSQGTNTAMEYWNAGGSPKASAKAPQDHKKKGGAKSGRPASTATKSTPAAEAPKTAPNSAESSETTGT